MTELAELAQGMEEAPIGMPFPQPPVEIVVHQAAIDVKKVSLPNGQTMTLAQFMTPAFTITVKLDDDAAKAVSDALRPSPIHIARQLPQ